MSRISLEPRKVSSRVASSDAEVRHVRHYPAVVKVTSPSFSSDQDLRAELRAVFPSAIFNTAGGRQLTSATIGIVGLGHVGKDVVRVLKPFACRVVANDIVDVSDFCAEHAVELVDKRTLYRMSDAVTLHVPLTPDTRGLID